MTKSFNAKALGAFRKLGAVALITATLAVFFTACNQTGGGGGGKPTPTSKHAVTFSVEGGNGTLKAKVEGEATETETSPINVEEGKTVTFTAKASKGYRVSTWVISPSSAIQSGGKKGETTATVKITGDTTVSVSFELIPPGEAQLRLGPTKRDIKIKAVTFDGSDVQVDGCQEGTLANNTETVLDATSTIIILRGKITELYCSGNELTELDVRDLAVLQELDCSNNQLKFLYVQDLTSLQSLGCQGNQLSTLNISGLISLKRLTCSENKLNAQAMTELLNALPAREASDKAIAKLYLDYTYEGNCKDFSTPESLKTALDGAKKRNWKLIKKDANGKDAEIE